MVAAVKRLFVTLILVLGMVPSGSSSVTCYSKSRGYRKCWNGCCGAGDDQDCCSSTPLILGLTLGGTSVFLAIVALILYWLCSDCQLKSCCRQRTRRRLRPRVRNNHRSHRRVWMVHPVAPPDYDTVIQERAPSAQPGVHSTSRNIPSSPPPSYTECTPSSKISNVAV